MMPIVQCRTEKQAQSVRAEIAARLKDSGLELHPEKMKVVYWKDDDRRSTYVNEKFDFPGYTVRPRRSENRYGKLFINFTPAISDKVAKEIRAEIRSWNLHGCTPDLRGITRQPVLSSVPRNPQSVHLGAAQE